MTPVGIVLAAGAGRRLRPYTDDLPKALVPIGDDMTVLDVTLANFAHVGLAEAVIVVGYRGDRIVERVHEYEASTGLSITIVENDRAEEWNNAYSLWTARAWLERGALIANGDTLHPASVARQLLAAGSCDAVLLAVDIVKPLGDEEMKVEVDGDRYVERISKQLPFDSFGEYIGVSFVPHSRAPKIVDTLERTWRADPGRYYEDGFQLFVEEGGRLRAEPVGVIPWTEIDDLADLTFAQELACRY
jgi:choline kinase